MAIKDEWIDITNRESTHEVQFNMATGAYRHRKFNLNRYAVSRVFELDNTGITDWVDGHPDERRQAALERSREPAPRNIHEEWD